MASCPFHRGDLRNVSNLDAMLAARASAAKEISVLILGWTHGTAQVSMRGSGPALIEAQVQALQRFSRHNYLVITPTTNNMCKAVLQKAGICCGWSDIGKEKMKSAEVWGLFPTHPYFLFLQRWWFAGEALSRGYSILSLDADLHLSTDPYTIVHSVALRHFDVLYQGDDGWPMRQQSHASGTKRMAVANKGAIHVHCPQKVWSHQCGGVCGVTGAPNLNTGFVWARAGLNGTARLFKDVVQTILGRMDQPPVRDPYNKSHLGRLWPQPVMNEIVFRLARRPSLNHAVRCSALQGHDGVNDGAGCHDDDQDCKPFRTPRNPDPLGVHMPSSWWVQTPRKASVWLASALGPYHTGTDGAQRHASEGTGTLSSNDILHNEMRDHLVAHTELEGGVRLGVLPRPLVGRLCAQRKQPLSMVTDVDGRERSASSMSRLLREVPCSELRASELLQQRVQHMQFTTTYTRAKVYTTLQWTSDTRAEESTQSQAKSSSIESQSPRCGVSANELAHWLPASAQAGVVIGSAVANHSLFCMLVSPSTNISTRCPCCWVLPATAASDTTHCPIWGGVNM